MNPNININCSECGGDIDLLYMEVSKDMWEYPVPYTICGRCGLKSYLQREIITSD